MDDKISSMFLTFFYWGVFFLFIMIVYYSLGGTIGMNEEREMLDSIELCIITKITLPDDAWLTHPIYDKKWKCFYIYVDVWEVQEEVWGYDWNIYEDEACTKGIDHGIKFDSFRDAKNGLKEYLKVQVVRNEKI